MFATSKVFHVNAKSQSVLSLKTRVLRHFVSAATARFRSPGEGEFGGQKTVGWVCMKIPNSDS